MTTDWHAFRRRWRRDGARALGATPPPLAAPLRCVALAAPFCAFEDAVRVARCSRAALRAARQIVAAVRRDVSRGGGRPVPVVGRPPLPAAPFPEGFRYARKLVLPRYTAFAGDEHDVHAEVRVAWLAAKRCWFGCGVCHVSRYAIDATTSPRTPSTRPARRGLVAGEHIPKGTRVVDYTGAVVSRHAARERERAEFEAGRPTYILSVVEHSRDESVAAWRTTVDATDCGGVSRFVNHSCAPNCEVVPTRSRRGQFLPTLALVTTVDVAVGVELTFDYAGGAPDDAVEDSRTECFCGARNCRGWLLRHVE